MSGIRFELQKQVFEATKERLHCVVPVNKLSRATKKGGHVAQSNNFLCVTGSIERPVRFTLYLVSITIKE